MAAASDTVRPMRAPVTRLLPVLLTGAMLTLAACGGPSGKGGPSTLPTAANPVTLTGGSTTLAIDPQTAGVLEDNAVTIRERDTTEQVRVPIDALLAEITSRLGF